MTREKYIVALIPVHNGLKYTKHGLKKLFESLSQTAPSKDKFEVIIIDDGSTDGTAEWIMNNYPQITVLAGNGNLWWSGSINKGARYAFNDLNADYILLWNNDITPEKEYFLNLSKLIRIHQEEQILASKIYFMHKPDVIWNMGGIFKPKSGKKLVIGLFHKDNIRFEQAQKCDWATGMGTLVPRQVVESIGCWDEKRFPQYHGDSDFTFRATKAGYKIIACPELKIWNDTKHTGMGHDDKIGTLIASLSDIRSNFNIKKDLLFYHLHGEGLFSYYGLLKKYFGYFGGFLKWKILGIFGKHRTDEYT